jgi:predicted methyltransferase
MSKLGETTDKILELLCKKENITLKELEKKVPQINPKILNFMDQEGLIELKNGEVIITEFGCRIITVE